MYGFCGWIGCESASPEAREILQSMSRRLALGAGPRAVVETAPGVAVAAFPTGGTCGVASARGRVAAIQGSHRWEDPELSRLACELGPAHAVLAAFERDGSDFVRHLRGAFSLAVLDAEGPNALLAIDRCGIGSMTWVREGDVLLFATASQALPAHPAGRRPVSDQAVYDYLYFGFVPAPVSIRTGYHRLEAAQCLETRDGADSTRFYWRMDFRNTSPRDLRGLEQEFLERIRVAVERLAGRPDVGCFLSGGTDSSTIAGYLGRITGSAARTYSIGFDVAAYSELAYSRLASKHFATDHHEAFVGPQDVAKAIPDIARAHGEPFGNESAVPTYFCARLAREDGVERLLGGDGGDELFAGNARYAFEEFLALYGRIPRWIRRGLVEPIVGKFPFGESIWPIRKARRYIARASTPMPRRFYAYSYVETIGAETIFDRSFLSRVDREHPHRMIESCYGSTLATSSLNRTLGSEMKFVLADNDLPKVTRSCLLAGVEAVYPFLDDDMVEFAARLPVRLKLRHMKLRWFFKHALRNFLPREILTKKKHGFGLPFGLWLSSEKVLADLATDSLESLRERGIIDRAYLDEIRRLHAQEHAVYYGAHIWHLMMLEQWFRIHGEPAA